jgi:ubiquitin conjugation factor E4 B
MLLNDAVWMLDRCIEMLSQIKKDENDMADVQSWSSLPQDVQSQREESYNQNGEHLSGQMRLANEQIHTIYYLSSQPKIAASFLSEVFIERMAQMLNYYILILLGPQVANLDVKNPSKYNFTPKVLLREILGIFLNLASCAERRTEFLQKVVSDERSFKASVFKRALRFFSKRNLISSEDFTRFQDIVNELEKLSCSVQDLDEILADAPEDFLDPLMQTVMRDPVHLPTSKVAMERSVIMRHLLNNPIDPFNRMPLRVEDLQPDIDLKKKIDAWIQERISLSKKNKSSIAIFDDEKEEENDSYKVFK